ncbi:Uncharacterized protein HZ326_30029 [Fusarium oxysporum f. sp. albedinis]|nr:Uncharacterized protein HZ326_30029 [Fusarium oxysporum f. sp. albedinis]
MLACLQDQMHAYLERPRRMVSRSISTVSQARRSSSVSCSHKIQHQSRHCYIFRRLPFNHIGLRRLASREKIHCHGVNKNTWRPLYVVYYFIVSCCHIFSLFSLLPSCGDEDCPTSTSATPLRFSSSN